VSISRYLEFSKSVDVTNHVLTNPKTDMGMCDDQIGSDPSLSLLSQHSHKRHPLQEMKQAHVFSTTDAEEDQS
jgi:hypothetical protein